MTLGPPGVAVPQNPRAGVRFECWLVRSKHERGFGNRGRVLYLQVLSRLLWYRAYLPPPRTSGLCLVCCSGRASPVDVESRRGTCVQDVGPWWPCSLGIGCEAETVRGLGTDRRPRGVDLRAVSPQPRRGRGRGAASASARPLPGRVRSATGKDPGHPRPESAQPKGPAPACHAPDGGGRPPGP